MFIPPSLPIRRQARRGEPQEPRRRRVGGAAALVDLHGATPGATHGEGGRRGSPGMGGMG